MERDGRPQRRKVVKAPCIAAGNSIDICRHSAEDNNTTDELWMLCALVAADERRALHVIAAALSVSRR